jgi:hypothetical protein
MISNAP